MERVLNKLEKIEERIGVIEQVLVKQEENLRLHMYRTDLAEQAIKANAEALKPVAEHVSRFKFTLTVAKWTLTALIGLVTVSASIAKIIEYLRR